MKKIIYLAITIVLSSSVVYACYIKDIVIDKSHDTSGQCSNGAGAVGCAKSYRTGLWGCDGPVRNSHFKNTKAEAVNEACGC